MTTPESKEKCCPACEDTCGSDHGCQNRTCHCHQRPESANCPNCKIEGNILTLCDYHFENGAHLDFTSHQRPESELRKGCDIEFDAEWEDIKERVQINPNDWSWINAAIQSLILRHIEAAYQRGREFNGPTIRKLEYDCDQYCIQISNLEMQNTRLLENNRTLQAKLREGNREMLAWIIEESTAIRTATDAKNFRQFLQTILVSQQEPQDV